MISIIIPVFNEENYIQRTINSILKQSYKNYEIIIIDDGSNDNTIKNIPKNKKIRILKNKKNKGIVYSLNKGIKHSKGEYIARIDAGDISNKKRLEKQINEFKKDKNLGIIGTWCNFIDEKNKEIITLRPPTNYSKIKKEILRHNLITHPTLMIKKEVIEEIGSYTDKFKYNEDYELVIKCIKKYKVKNIPEILTTCLIRKKGLSYKKEKKQRWNSIKLRINAIKKYNYPKHNVIHIIKPLFLLIIPVGMKYKIREITQR
ncbi:MAG: glycosyltransferase [Candidatus Woesearchaeota archaeon]